MVDRLGKREIFEVYSTVSEGVLLGLRIAGIMTATAFPGLLCTPLELEATGVRRLPAITFNLPTRLPKGLDEMVVISTPGAKTDRDLPPFEQRLVNESANIDVDTALLVAKERAMTHGTVRWRPLQMRDVDRCVCLFVTASAELNNIPLDIKDLCWRHAGQQIIARLERLFEESDTGALPGLSGDDQGKGLWLAQQNIAAGMALQQASGILERAADIVARETTLPALVTNRFFELNRNQKVKAALSSVGSKKQAEAFLSYWAKCADPEDGGPLGNVLVGDLVARAVQALAEQAKSGEGNTATLYDVLIAFVEGASRRHADAFLNLEPPPGLGEEELKCWNTLTETFHCLFPILQGPSNPALANEILEGAGPDAPPGLHNCVSRYLRDAGLAAPVRLRIRDVAPPGPARAPAAVHPGSAHNEARGKAPAKPAKAVLQNDAAPLRREEPRDEEQEGIQFAYALDASAREALAASTQASSAPAPAKVPVLARFICRAPRPTRPARPGPPR
eukprot:tig00000189_g14322.t1